MALTTDDRNFIKREDDNLRLSLENKVSKIVIGQIMTAIPIIFFLGGIFFQFREGVDKLDFIQKELEVRQTWMVERERSETHLIDWAKTKGYTPSNYSPRSYRDIKNK